MPTTRAMALSEANAAVAVPAPLVAEAEDITPDPTITNLNRHITVIIGDKKARISVPESIICFHSDFFKTACNERWESGRQKLVNLEDENPTYFSIFVTWMYTQSIYGTEALQDTDFADPAVTKKNKKIHAQWDILVRCFILAQYIQAPAFQNAVCDALVKSSKLHSVHLNTLAGATYSSTQYIWSNTPPGSLLRQLILQDYAAGVKITTPLNKTHFPEFYQDLAEYTLMGLRHPKEHTYRLRAWEKKSCHFHIHSGAKERYSCLKKD